MQNDFTMRNKNTLPVWLEALLSTSFSSLSNSWQKNIAALEGSTTIRAIWLIEQGLTSHQTHYRSYRGRVFTGQMTQSTVSQHWRTMGPKDWASIPSGPPHRAHNKLIQHTQYTYRQTQKSMHSEMNPVWQNPIQRTVSNCSSKCAYHCAQNKNT